MKTKLTLLLLLLTSLASAQDAKAVAKLMLDLDGALPRLTDKQNQGQGMPNLSVDWEKAVTRLGELATRAASTSVEPLVLYQLGTALYNCGQVEEAMSTLRDLSDRFPTHPLVTLSLEKGGKSRAARALDDCVEELAFRSQHKVLTLSKAQLDPEVTATLHFSVGDVKIGFYTNVAPQHVKNFLTLAKSSAYDRTHIHHVAPGQWVKLGDPWSRDRSMDQWGKGGPEHVLDNEFSRATHKKGVLSMWRGPGRPKSHGSQFMVLLADQPHLDFVQTPFAEVLSGLEILDAVSRKTRNQYEAPAEEVFLNGITIERKAAGK
ncbi:MAG: peptidylprolyl isomerase [Planctomycetes bacterium]|nr:peptidylprolyl isomerase [Planctomycetota bacterium]